MTEDPKRLRLLNSLTEEAADRIIQSLSSEIESYAELKAARDRRTLQRNHNQIQVPHTQLRNLTELIEKRKLYETSCGVYFLFEGDEIIYIGQSHNIFRRLEEHQKRFFFSHFSYILTTEEDLIQLEVSYLNVFRPRLNLFGHKHGRLYLREDSVEKKDD